MANSRCT